MEREESPSVLRHALDSSEILSGTHLERSTLGHIDSPVPTAPKHYPQLDEEQANDRGDLVPGGSAGAKGESLQADVQYLQEGREEQQPEGLSLLHVQHFQALGDDKLGRKGRRREILGDADDERLALAHLQGTEGRAMGGGGARRRVSRRCGGRDVVNWSTWTARRIPKTKKQILSTVIYCSCHSTDAYFLGNATDCQAQPNVHPCSFSASTDPRGVHLPTMHGLTRLEIRPRLSRSFQDCMRYPQETELAV